MSFSDVNSQVGEGVIYDFGWLFMLTATHSLRFFTNSKVGELMTADNDVVAHKMRSAIPLLPYHQYHSSCGSFGGHAYMECDSR
jgi:hypothetical protein